MDKNQKEVKQPGRVKGPNVCLVRPIAEEERGYILRGKGSRFS